MWRGCGTLRANFIGDQHHWLDIEDEVRSGVNNVPWQRGIS
jgi:hypothetical protein